MMAASAPASKATQLRGWLAEPGMSTCKQASHWASPNDTSFSCERCTSPPTEWAVRKWASNADSLGNCVEQQERGPTGAGGTLIAAEARFVPLGGALAALDTGGAWLAPEAELVE